MFRSFERHRWAKLNCNAKVIADALKVKTFCQILIHSKFLFEVSYENFEQQSPTHDMAFLFRIKLGELYKMSG